MEDGNNKSRRKFLDKGLKFGFISILGAIGLSKLASKMSANSNSGDKVELMTTDGTLIEVDSSEVMSVDHPEDNDKKYKLREGDSNRKYVMVIDLAKCKNALK
ncbi:MAG TPA: hypothetical protein VLQ91_12135, partial [Draconibacterium sp.]|nr:hypothetical protein [Draconibacterium sp.]